MADPTHSPRGLPLVDNFNRADGDPGSSWIALSPVSKLSIVSHQAVAAGVAGMKWFRPPVTTNCEVWGKVGGDGTARIIFYARMNGSSLYQLSCVPDNNSPLHISKYVDGVGTSLAQGTTWNIASGRSIALACSGSILAGFLWNGSAWVRECSVFDTSLPLAGDTAVYCDVAGHTSTLDNFGVSGQGLHSGSPEEEKEQYLWYRADGLHDPVVPQENWLSWTG